MLPRKSHYLTLARRGFQGKKDHGLQRRFGRRRQALLFARLQAPVSCWRGFWFAHVLDWVGQRFHTPHSVLAMVNRCESNSR